MKVVVLHKIENFIIETFFHLSSFTSQNIQNSATKCDKKIASNILLEMNLWCSGLTP